MNPKVIVMNRSGAPSLNFRFMHKKEFASLDIDVFLL